MKNSKSILLYILLSFVFVACTTNGNQSASDKPVAETKQVITFTEEDIGSAISQVQQMFDNDFSGCEISIIYYNYERTNKEADNNTIIIYTKFKTDSSVKPGVNSLLSPNMTYEWYWKLKKHNELNKWEIVSYGFD